MNVRIAGLQMLVGADVSENESRILAGIERAAGDGADFLLTPEGALSGYYADFDRVQVAEALERVTTRAREFAVGLALGTCWKEIVAGREYCWNQVRVYSPEGEYLGFHAKILRCSPLDLPGTGEMTSYVEGVLRTFEWKGVRFGCLICNDMWATPGCTVVPNPFLPWKLKQMGAQFILHAINSGTVQFYKPYHESNVELWARSLGIPIVGVNAAGPNGEPSNVRSGLVRPDGARPVRAPYVGEQYFACVLSF